MADSNYNTPMSEPSPAHSDTQSSPRGVGAGAFNLGVNESGNFRDGIWDMPAPATASEADAAINMVRIINVKATGYGADDGNRMGDSLPHTGGNDGTIPDVIIGTSDAQRGNDKTGNGR